MVYPGAHPLSLRSAIAWSLGLHVLCLIVLMVGGQFGAPFRFLRQMPATLSPEKALNVWLKPQAPLGTTSSSQHGDVASLIPPAIAIVAAEARPKQEHGKAAVHKASIDTIDVAESRLSEADGYRAPQLLTDVGSEVYGVTQSGSITVRVDVDAEGLPSNLVRLNSSVPPIVALALEQRILAARFRPAERDGVALIGTLEITVMVAPSLMMKTLDAS